MRIQLIYLTYLYYSNLSMNAGSNRCYEVTVKALNLSQDLPASQQVGY